MKSACLAISLCAIISLVLAVTPDEFDSKVNNLVYLNEGYVFVTEPPNFNPAERHSPTSMPEPEWKLAAQRLKADYRAAYNAKQAGDQSALKANYELMLNDFGIMKAGIYFKIDLTPFKDMFDKELGMEPSPSAIPTPTPVNQIISDPSVIVYNVAPTDSKRVIPTIPPDQYRGKKNIIYAIAEILWDNILLIGAFIVGILILYALFNREESESNFG